MEEVLNFLQKAGTYYLATVDGDKARVRPFGTIVKYEDKLYVLTSKDKYVSKQLAVNPNAEVCAMLGDTQWIRVCGELIDDDRVEVKEYVIEQYPELKTMYSANSPNTQVLYFRNATATIYSYTGAPREIKF